MKTSLIMWAIILSLQSSVYPQPQLRAQQIQHRPIALQPNQQYWALSNSSSNQKVKIVDRDGRLDSVSAVNIPITAKAIQVNQAITLASKREKESLRRRFADEVFSTPNTIVRYLPEQYLDRSGNQLRRYKLAFMEEMPLRFNRDDNAFEGSISFFLVEEPYDPNNTSFNLSEPIMPTISSPHINSIEPKTPKIHSLYFPAQEIKLKASNAKDSALIKVRTPLNYDGYETYVKIEPALQILCDRKAIQGLGVQTVPVFVQMMGSNSDEKITVTLSEGERGAFAEQKIELQYNKPEKVMLRSEGIGKTTIKANSSLYGDSNGLTIEFKPPILFFLLAIGGGLIGAVVKFYTKDKGEKLPFRSALVGMGIGFIVAGAYFVVGLNLLRFELDRTFNELGIMVVSALGGYFGIRGSRDDS